jgi:scyllo-inositol 2-dehydrogenase (NADP+)
VVNRAGKIKVGVIGTGWVATARHVPALRRHPSVQLVAVFDRNADKARAAAQAWKVPLWFSQEQEFLSQDLDMVTICTPPWTHADLACAAFDRRLHVFTEKPMAINAQDAKAMIAASEKAQRLLCVSHNFLFSRSVTRADRILNAQSPVRYASGLQMSSVQRRLPDWYQKLPGGLMLDESPHMIYTLQHFLGKLQLDGCRATLNPTTGLPATVEVRIRGEHGDGQIVMLFETPVSEWHIGLINRDRIIDLDLFRDIIVSIGSDGQHKPLNILRTSLRAMRGHAAGFIRSGSKYAIHRLSWGHERLIHGFVDATLGRGPVPVDPADSLEVVRLTDEILAELSLT